MASLTLTPARRERLIAFGAWFVLLAALLPNVTYLGHWPIGGLDVHFDDGADPAATLAEHEDHCHVGPAHCGGGESMVGTPFAGEDSGALSFPGSEMKFDAGHDQRPQDGFAARILQPPRSRSYF
jgi:hypothetical protein